MFFMIMSNVPVWVWVAEYCSGVARRAGGFDSLSNSSGALSTEGIRLVRWLRLVIATVLMSPRCLKGIDDGQSHAAHSVSGSTELSLSGKRSY